jgi:hypothetical protein
VRVIVGRHSAEAIRSHNRPGAAPELHDLAFQQRLNNAHMLALRRARRVTSYQGYSAVLAGFATDMGDKHIWSRPAFVINTPRWAKIIVSKRGDAWIVTDADQPQTTLLGASLIGCDGGSRKKSGSKESRRVPHRLERRCPTDPGRAPWMLVDEGNPFIPRPKDCVFDHNDQFETVTLEWTRIKRDMFLPRLQKAIGAGAAGYGDPWSFESTAESCLTAKRMRLVS